MRKLHCEEIIKDCEELLESIKLKEIEHIDSGDTEVIIPKVKSLLEHCRSLLEYCAQDVFELIISEEERENKLQSRNKNVYFPYGDTKDKFESSIKRNLPGLHKTNPIYKIIESLQDYRRFTKKKFLSYMCYLTNQNKHNQLSEQEVKSETTVRIGNLISSTNSNVTFVNSTYNGMPMGDFQITTDGNIVGNINPLLLEETIIYREGYLLFEVRNFPYAARFETFQRGNGYVGSSSNLYHLDGTYLALLQAWSHHLAGSQQVYLDYTESKSEEKVINEILEYIKQYD